MELLAQAADPNAIDWIAATKELGFPIAICLILLFAIGSTLSGVGYAVYRVCNWLSPYVTRSIDTFIHLMSTLQDSAIKHDDINARTTNAIEKMSDTQQQASLHGLETVKELKGISESQRALMSTAVQIAATLQETHEGMKTIMQQQQQLSEKLPLIAIQGKTIEVHDHQTGDVTKQ